MKLKYSETIRTILVKPHLPNLTDCSLTWKKTVFFTCAVFLLPFFVTSGGITIAVFPAAGLAQSVERLTAEREVVGSIPGTVPTLRVLK